MKAILFAAQAGVIALSLMATTGNARAEQQCPLGEKDNSAIQEICPFKGGLARIKINHQWGFVSLTGQLVIKPQFDLVEDFSEGFAIAQVDEKWGVINQQGKWVVNPRFDRLYPFSQGLAAAEENGLSGFIDPTGKWVIEPKYDNAGSFYGPVAIVSEGYRRALMIDRTGSVIKRFGPDVDVHHYANSFGLFEANVKFEPTLQHVDGRTLPYPKAASIYFDSAYQDGRLIATEKVKRDEETVELHGMVDLQGQWVIPAKFRSLELLPGGFAIASPDRGKELEREVFGMIDKTGEFVAKPIYAYIRGDNNGYYHAKHMGTANKEDVLDKSGKILITSDCADGLSEKRSLSKTSLWAVYAACGQTWVLHKELGLIKSKVMNPEVYESADHMMLVSEDADNAGSDNANKGKSFEIYDSSGKLVLDSNAPAVQGKYDDAMLISSNGALAQQSKHLLPVALLVNKYRSVAVVTRDYAVVSSPEWIYESELLAYRYASDGQPLDGPLVMKTKEGWGAVDANGTWVVPPKHWRLTPFRNGVAYAENGRDELIVDRDNKEYKFPEKGRGYKRIAPFVLEGYEPGERVIRLDLKSGTVTSTKITQSSEIEIDKFHSDLAPAKKDNLWGLIDKDRNWALSPQFGARIEPLLDDAGKLIGWKSSNYYEGSSSYSTQSYGLINPQGREVLPPRFSSVEFNPKSKMVFVTENDHMNGVYSLDGKPVINLFHGRATYLGDGWFALAKEEIHGLIDARGEWALKPSPIHVSNFMSNENGGDGKRPYVVVGEGPGRKLMDIQGRISTQEAPLSMEQENPEWWWPQWQNRYKDDEFTAFYGFDFKERIRVPGQVGPYDNYSEGVVVFKPRKQTDKAQLGLADSKGNVLGLYPFESIEPMRNGFAVVSKNKPVMRNSKKGSSSEDDGNGRSLRYGYLNRLGKLAIPLKFEVASHFAEGRATVISNGNLGLIDEQGRFILQGAWICGRQPAILDNKKKILWPEGARNIRSCAR